MRTTDTDPLVSKASRLLHEIVEGYTAYHQDILIDGVKLGGQIILTLRVHNDDHRKVVGSQGTNIWALQTLFAAYTLTHNLRLRLTLLPPKVGERTNVPLEFISRKGWKPDAMLSRLRHVLDATLGTPYSLQHADVEETTTVIITPAIWEEMIDRGDYPKALHNILHAIGKNEGRLVQIDFEQPKTSAVR